jgi:hypothetical protein
MKAGSEITHVINPNGVYNLDGAQRVLGLTRTTLRREVRQGRLRVSKRAGRYFILGEWLLEWIRKGELRRERHPITVAVGDAA